MQISIRRILSILTIVVLSLLFTGGISTESYAAKKSSKKYVIPDSKKFKVKGTGLKIKKTPRPTSRRTARVQSARLREAVNLYRQDKIDASMLALDAVLNDPKVNANDRGIAQFFMGKALFRKQLYYSSVPYFQAVLKDYRSAIFYPYSFQRLVWIARRDNKFDVLTDVLKGKRSTLVPRNYRDDVYYMLANAFFDAGEFKAAIKSVDAIQQGSEHYHESLLKKAYILIGARKYKLAIKVLNKAAESPEEDIKGLAFLAIARLYYGLGEDKLAAINYQRIDQSSKYWLMAQLESAWAHFRSNEPSQALGNVHPFDTEPFAGVFAPEASVIKATVFFRLCKYSAAEKAILTFFERYVPVYQRLEIFNKKYSKKYAKYRNEILNLIFNKSAELPKLVSNEIFAQTWFETRINQLASIKKELERLEKMSAFAGTKAGQLSRKYLKDSSTVLSNRLVQRAIPLLREWEQKLEKFLRQASLLRFESAYATIDFERSNLSGRVEVPDDPQYEVWTFDDEFWKDELGDYRYLLRSECRGQDL